MADESMRFYSAARQVNDLRLFIPLTFRSFYDLPWPVFWYIEASSLYYDLSRMPADIKPPKEIWGNSDKLEMFFIQQKAIRDSKNAANQQTIFSSRR